MSPNIRTLKGKPEIAIREFRATLFGVCFASTVAVVGVAVGLKPTTLTGLAALHQKACTDNPALLSWTQHVIPLMPTVFGLLLFVPVLCAGWTLLRQALETSRLNGHVQRTSGPVPSKLAKIARSLHLRDHIVCVQDHALYAFCFGLVSPRICISTAMVRKLSKQELEAVLLHEACHLRHRDPLRLLTSRVVASALVLLPVANELRERYHLSMELAADQKALARMPVEVLASALLKVFASASAPRYELVAVGALDVTRERILRLAGKGDTGSIPPLRRSSLLISAFVSLALFVGTAGFSEASGYWAGRAHNCRAITTVNTATTTPPSKPKVTTTKCSHTDGRLEIPARK